jgi:hypothetical protein
MAGVVYQDVDVVQRLWQAIEQAIDRYPVGHVEFERVSQGSKSSGGCLEPVETAARAHDAAADCDQRRRHRRPDPAPRAGDQRHRPPVRMALSH